jgi:transmembrane sensor
VDERHWRSLVRLFSGEASAAERDELRRWVGEDPARAEEVDRLRALWDASGALPGSGDEDAAWQRVAARTGLLDATPPGVHPIDARLRRAAAPPRRAAWRAPLLRIAAVLVLALGGALVWAQAARAGTRTVSTGKGERVQLVLSDGSRVLLGVDSRLTYPRRFRGGAREVRLRGAAYFEVARDPERPFSVYTADAVTRVLGTRFTVRDYPGGEPARVAVTEGRVAVRPARERAPAAVLVGGQAAELAPGGARPVVERAEPRQDLAWTRGQIAFNNAPVPEVLAELGRWYDVQIQVQDPVLAARHLTIAFEHEPLETLLQEISAVLGARVERRGRVLVLTPAPAARGTAPARGARGESL